MRWMLLSTGKSGMSKAKSSVHAAVFWPMPKMLVRYSLASSGERTKTVLGDLLCCLPQVEVPDDLGYDKVFRVAIVSFLDRYNFCIAAVKRSCIHFVTPGAKIIPFDTYNLFYRNGLDVKLRETAHV